MAGYILLGFFCVLVIAAGIGKMRKGKRLF
jgi:hypothetical protein